MPIKSGTFSSGMLFRRDEVSGDNADGLHVHYILLEQNAHHDQNYLMMVNKRREESEKFFCLKAAMNQTLTLMKLTLNMIVTFLFLLSGAAKRIYISIGATCLG